VLAVAVGCLMRRDLDAKQRERVAEVILGRLFAVPVAVRMSISVGADGDWPMRQDVLPEQR